MYLLSDLAVIKIGQIEDTTAPENLEAKEYAPVEVPSHFKPTHVK